MTSCDFVRENLSAYYDNELSADVRQKIEQHLSVCHNCSAELDEIARIAQICADLPECDLPDGFRDELHEKLVAAAGKKTVINIKNRKRIAVFRSKAVISVAAGILLIFLAGSFYKMGLFSPKSMNGATMAAAPSDMADDAASAGKGESYSIMRAPEAQNDSSYEIAQVPEIGENNSYTISQASETEKESSDMTSEAPKAESKETNSNTQKKGENNTKPILRGFNKADVTVSSNGTDRSSTCSQNEIMGIASVSEETISHKTSTITITNEDIDYVIKTINTAAAENGSTAADDKNEQEPDDEIAMFGASSVSDGSDQKNVDRRELNYLIPVDKYDKFVSELTGIFGESSVQVGSYVTEDMTGTLEKLRSQLDEINTSIEKLDNSAEKGNKAKVEQLEKERSDIESQIEQITVENDFVSISIFIYNE